MNAIMYGAGNIGRGFIGQLFHMSGYEISFIDVNMTVIDKLNTDGQYPVYITEADGYREYLVTGVRGVNGRDNEAIAEAMAEADIMATAVGVNILKFIAKPLAAGIEKRASIAIICFKEEEFYQKNNEIITSYGKLYNVNIYKNYNW